MRASFADLLPIELEGVTLPQALSRLVDEVAETFGLSSRVSFSGIDEHGYPEGEHTLSPIAERMLFLVAREALYQLRQRKGLTEGAAQALIDRLLASLDHK